jgi:hypothetical protein
MAVHICLFVGLIPMIRANTLDVIAVEYIHVSRAICFKCILLPFGISMPSFGELLMVSTLLLLAFNAIDVLTRSLRLYVFPLLGQWSAFWMYFRNLFPRWS